MSNLVCASTHNEIDGLSRGDNRALTISLIGLINDFEEY